MEKQTNISANTTRVFTDHWKHWHDEDIQVIAHQGGSRSSKTYSIAQSIVAICLQNRNITFSIVRKTLPALKATVIKDVLEILNDWNIGAPVTNHHRAAGRIIFPSGSEIDYFSVDDEQKIRGRKRDFLYINECNELTHDEYTQLKLRTSGKVVLDFNPSDDSGWHYDVMSLPGSVVIHSTYKDNPYLSQSQVDYIESLKDVDENLYRVYTLGERPIRSEQVYKHFKFVDPSWKGQGVAKVSYGIDWGFNDPTVVVKAMVYEDNSVFFDEIYRETGKTTAELLDDFDKLSFKDAVLWCDHRPEIVEELRRRGFDARNASKPIELGIDMIKSMKVFVNNKCLDLQEEVKKYSYRTVKTGNKSDNVPLDRFNHGLDACRYAVFNAHKPDPEMMFAVSFTPAPTQW